jgi:enoyl-CoA hydratase/carnithine racemase
MRNIPQDSPQLVTRLRSSGKLEPDYQNTRATPVGLAPENRQILFLSRLTNINTVVIRKISPRFPESCVRTLERTFDELEAGRLGELKFVVFDFAHAGDPAEPSGSGFERLMDRLIDLVVASPVITVAWTRGKMRDADLEFALRCSALLADPAAKFSFDCAPERIGSLYAVLTRRLGLVRAERLLESGDTLDAAAMRDLCLVKDLVDTHDGLAAIKTYLMCYARRYNGNLAILRAQRMAERGLAGSSDALRDGSTNGAAATRSPRRAAKVSATLRRASDSPS